MQSSQEEKQLYIGYDLNNRFVQISYLGSHMEEPKTLSTIIGREQFQIPAVLCKRKGIGQWYYGEEAKKVALKQEGILIDNLLDLCKQQETIELDGEVFSTIKLLSLFIKKTLKVFNSVGKISQIQKFVFTVEELDDKTFQMLEQLEDTLQIPKECFHIQDYKESFYYYTYSQSEQIWNNDVELFDLQDKKLISYSMRRDIKTMPQIVTVKERVFGELAALDLGEENLSKEEFEKKKDQIFGKIIEDIFQKRVISTVFLIGSQFEEFEARESLRLLCKGRRVFQGQNLYSKGACYAAYSLGKNLSWNKIYLGESKVRFNIGIEVNNKGNMEYLSFITAGIDWYKANSCCYVILDNSLIIELQVQPIQGTEKQLKKLELSGLPKRPNKTTRLKIEVSFEKRNVIKVTVKDMGFGEFYPSSNKIWEFTETL